MKNLYITFYNEENDPLTSFELPSIPFKEGDDISIDVEVENLELWDVKPYNLIGTVYKIGDFNLSRNYPMVGFEITNMLFVSVWLKNVKKEIVK